MPQFDFYTFLTLSFWITLGAFVFFLIYTKFFLISTSEVLKLREKLKKSSINFNKSIVGYYGAAIKYFK